jgi:hypothetical protein
MASLNHSITAVSVSLLAVEASLKMKRLLDAQTLSQIQQNFVFTRDELGSSSWEMAVDSDERVIPRSSPPTWLSGDASALSITSFKTVTNYTQDITLSKGL